MSVSPDGRRLTSIATDDSILVWNVTGKSILARRGGYPTAGQRGCLLG